MKLKITTASPDVLKEKILDKRLLYRVNLRIQLAVLVKPLTRKGFTSQHALTLKFSLYR